MRKIRELGSLPADAFDKYQGHSLSQVLAAVSTSLPLPLFTPSTSAHSFGRSSTSATLS